MLAGRLSHLAAMPLPSAGCDGCVAGASAGCDATADVVRCCFCPFGAYGFEKSVQLGKSPLSFGFPSMGICPSCIASYLLWNSAKASSKSMIGIRMLRTKLSIGCALGLPSGSQQIFDLSLLEATSTGTSIAAITTEPRAATQMLFVDLKNLF